MYFENIKNCCSGYQELHVHTVNSLRDAANTVQDVFDAAEELGRNAVSITDHGNWMALFAALKEQTKREKKILKEELSRLGICDAEIEAILKTMGAFDTVRNPNNKMIPFIEKYEEAFVNTAKKSIKFVPGIEMYEGEMKDNDTSHHHIVFYAKDWEGMKALFLLCNFAQLNKYKDMPRCTLETMKTFLGPGTPGHNRVIATSACMGGHMQNILLKPFRLQEKLRELSEKKEAVSCVSEETLVHLQESLNAKKTELQIKNEELKQVKKLVNKLVSSENAVLRTQKALSNAEHKYGGKILQSTLFGSTEKDARLIAAEEKHLAAVRQREACFEAKKKLPILQEETKNLSEQIKIGNKTYRDLVQKNAPAQKITEKIKEVKAEYESLDNVYEKAKELALQYESILGKGNFFIELQDHGIFEETIIHDDLIRIAKQTNIPLTVSNDVHYKNPSMQRKRDLIAAMRFPDTKLEDISERQGNNQLYFKSNEQMAKLFCDVPEALDNTSLIANSCNVFYTKEMHLPTFEDQKWGLSPANYLRKITTDNINVRYPDFDSWSANKKTDFNNRVDYELSVIEKMGYSSYISIVEDFISYAKNNFSSDSVGPGRGSGAGSLVCFLTGITNIDPLKYNLIFERFLNPERVSMPK